MSLESEFKADPMDFLKEGTGGHIIVVPPGTDTTCDSPGKYRFSLEAGTRNQVFLKPAAASSSDSITAYYLPWKMYEAVAMDLGSEADFFFTSEMTNCRFTVWDDDPKKPKVSHVSGAVKNGNASKARNEMEQAAGLDTSKGRRLSIAGGRDVYTGMGKAKTLKTAKVHEYRGQQQTGGGASSAFVFGRRDAKGEWSFCAQIVKGNMAEVKLIEEDLTALGHVYI